MDKLTWSEWRQAKGIRTKFITERLRITRQTLYNKESGIKSNFSFSEGLKYCDILGIQPDQVKM